MRAAASLRTERRDGRDELVERRSPAPFSVRRCGDRILIGSSAATPVGGDDLALHIDVGEGSHAAVGSVAAGMIWPGVGAAGSVMATTANVGAAARLDLWLEPAISVAGSSHLMTTHVRLEAGATLRVVDELVLGRTGEPSGAVTLSLRIERDGRPLVHHSERFGPDVAGASSSVSVGGARHVLSAALVGVDAGRSRVRVLPDGAAAWLPVADDAVVVLAVGPDRPAVHDLIRELAPELVAGSATASIMV